MSTAVTLQLAEVFALTTEIFTAHGVAAEHARAIATTVTSAERDGCTSHGLFRLPGYIAAVRNGTVNPQARPALTELAPAVLRIDADGGFAPLALERGHAPLAAKAAEFGIAALAINNCYHFAALWPEIEALTEHGLVAFAFTAAKSYVAPAGGRQPLYGTNPMAFGWPRGAGKPPLVFDQASSAAARGEIMIHERDGKSLPAGWAIDSAGEPTTDPSAALAGAQLPFGGYKGAAIALMVELLAGPLIGDLLSFEASANDPDNSAPPRGGELLLALRPGAFQPSTGRGAAEHGEALFGRILEQPGARLPSDRRYAARQRTPTTGVQVPPGLHAKLQALRRAADADG